MIKNDKEKRDMRRQIRELERKLVITEQEGEIFTITPSWWKPWNPERVGRAVGVVLASDKYLGWLTLDPHGFLCKVIRANRETVGDTNARLSQLVEGVK